MRSVYARVKKRGKVRLGSCISRGREGVTTKKREIRERALGGIRCERREICTTNKVKGN